MPAANHGAARRSRAAKIWLNLATMPLPPAVSVVVPCYNAAAFLPSTLRSVQAQQGFDLQIIVVDDGSSDGSPDLVARDFPDVTLVRQANAGVAAARNTGLAHARHDWVAFIDADDLWLPGKLQAQWDLLASHPEAGMAYTAWKVWTSDAPVPDPAWLAALLATDGDAQRWQGASGWIYPELLVDCVVWTSSVLVRRELLARAGGFDDTLRIGEDWDLWLRLSRLTPILRVPRPLALYRMHPHSITKAPPDTNFKHLIVTRALQRWGTAGTDGRRARMADVKRSQARTWGDLAGARLQLGQLEQARSDALHALRLAPLAWLSWRVLARSLTRQSPP